MNDRRTDLGRLDSTDSRLGSLCCGDGGFVVEEEPAADTGDTSLDMPNEARLGLLLDRASSVVFRETEEGSSTKALPFSGADSSGNFTRFTS